MMDVVRSVAVCIQRPDLLGRIKDIACRFCFDLRELGWEEIADAIIADPELTVLLSLESAAFLDIAAHLHGAGIDTQSRLIRLVDASNPAMKEETARICRAVDVPRSDGLLKEILEQSGSLRADEGGLQTGPVPGRMDSMKDVPPLAQRKRRNSHTGQPASGPAVPEVDEQQGIDLDHEVYTIARRVAATNVDIVIVGETGTGKDWLARYIHRHSGATGPFVAVNCAAIPETLAEAELFGVEAGAYTGAVSARAGKIEAADGGTLYLDEIDSMPLNLQVKLLRVLQERGVERVGSTVFRPSSFRIIVSTKTALAELVAQRKFRADLYYRLNVVQLTLPLLRTQPQRLLSLFWRYVAESSARFHTDCRTVPTAIIEAQLLAHAWEGNIRELRAAAQRFSLGFPLFEPQHGSADPVSLKDILNGYERMLLISTMNRCGRDVSRASKELCVAPHVLYYKLKSLGIEVSRKHS